MTDEISKMKEDMKATMDIVKVIRDMETDATSKALHAATIAYASGIRAGAEIAKPMGAA